MDYQSIINALKESALEYTGLAILATFIIFLSIIRKKITEYIFSRTIEKIKKKFIKKKFDKFEVTKDTQIREMLIELRTLTNSQRGALFQFHNGNVFTNKNPIWKVSNTHESVSPGTSSEIGNLQDIKASTIIDLIACFWDEDNRTGIYQVSPKYCESDCPHKNEDPHKKRVFFYDINELEEGYSKTLLIEHGIHYMLVCPIYNEEKQYIGYISVDYCEENKNTEKIKKRSSIVCRHASHILFALTNSK